MDNTNGHYKKKKISYTDKNDSFFLRFSNEKEIVTKWPKKLLQKDNDLFELAKHPNKQFIKQILQSQVYYNNPFCINTPKQ